VFENKFQNVIKYFPDFKRLCWNPISNFIMKVKPHGPFHKVFMKIKFISEKCISYYFKTLCWIIENFRNWFESIWISNAKVIKELENRKRKKRKKEEKNIKRPRGNCPARSQKRPTARLPRIPNRYLLSSFSLWRAGPTGQVLLPPAKILRWPSPRAWFPPLLIPYYSLPVSSSRRAYK
jgi:hypothetical protein